MVDEKLVSIIIPVYNSEKYLVPCIESVLKQTFTDFELLLIDDGSSDRSAEIGRYYQEKDKRVRLIQQKNAGASAARNRGLEEAQGSYIMFVDSDDYIEPVLLERAYGAIQKSHADLYISGCVEEYSEREKIISSRIYAANGSREYTVKGLLEGVGDDFPDSYIQGPGAKLYTRESIEAGPIRFNCDLSLWEDFLFNQEVLSKTRKIYISSDAYYHYRRGNQDSLSCRVCPRYYEMSTCVYDHMRRVMRECGCSGESIRRFEHKYFAAISYGIIRLYLHQYHQTDSKDRRDIIHKVSGNPYVRKLPLREAKTQNEKLLLLLLKLRMTGLLDKLLEIRYQTGIFGLYKKRTEGQRP